MQAMQQGVLMQYIGFLLSGCEYTIPILKVQEIINMPAVTRLPQSSGYLDGVTNLRGRVIPVINLKKMIGIKCDIAGAKVIVISSGKMTFGVVVDTITGVISIEQERIEPSAAFMNVEGDKIEGVARLEDRLVVLLDTRKLIPVDDLSMFEDDVLDFRDNGKDQVEVIKTVNGMGGKMHVTEVIDARTFFDRKNYQSGDLRAEVYAQLLEFMECIAAGDYEKADAIVRKLAPGSPGQASAAQDKLFREVGKVTRKLHDSIKSFKEAIDPRLKCMAVKDMPSAIDRLELVIEKTEEAANRTMGIVEKYILTMDDLSANIRSIKGNDESVAYLKKFKRELEDDLTEILTTQSFQDLTGQTLKKVITLVSDIEKELVGLVATFGAKPDALVQAAVLAEEKVSQEGVDDLLKEFGF